MVQSRSFRDFLIPSLLVLGLILALSFGMALDTTPAGAAANATPTVTGAPGNPTCPAGTTELKVEPVADGTYTSGPLTVTIDVRDTGSGPVFDFTANIPISTVIVKGGPDANIYTYSPSVTSDTGLHAPVNPSNGNYYGLSHISFCYPPPPTPTNTPVPPTNTPTKTNTPVPPTATPTNTPTNTPVPPTNTATNTPTNTPVPPTNTPTKTNTPVPPTNTPTNTPVPPTATPTNTPKVSPEPPTATPTNTPKVSPEPPTATPTYTPTPGEPTGEDPNGEPGASTIYLPFVNNR